jgi:hypothetical protein
VNGLVFVLDQQDRLRAVLDAARRVADQLFVGPVGQREVDLERGPVIRLAVDRDVPAALLLDAKHGRQTEPRALPDLLGREKWFEDARTPRSGRS